MVRPEKLLSMTNGGAGVLAGIVQPVTLMALMAAAAGAACNSAWVGGRWATAKSAPARKSLPAEAPSVKAAMLPVARTALPRAEPATVTVPMATWAFAEVSTPRSLPWGGEPGWAVSGVRWVRGPAE